MQNNRQEEQKDGIMKSLAIAGFVGLIIVIAWLGIKLVQVLPTAFGSLASLADSVYQYGEQDLTVAADKTTAAAGETITIAWNVTPRAGTYAFSYECSEGLVLEMRDSEGALKTLTCDTNYNIGAVRDIVLVAKAEKNRFTDLKYQVDFIPSGKEAPTQSDQGSLTIVNATIASVPPLAIATSTSTSTPVVTTPAPTKPITPNKPTTPTTPPKPVYVQTPVYGIPTSNPNGFTDLAATFVGSGNLINGNFRNTTVVDNDSTGAIQFAVKNLGTKTSETWTYTVKLPNGEVYTSPSQTALKPNERAVITLGFTTGDTLGIKNWDAKVSVTSDSKPSNNVFATVVAIID